MDAGSDADAGSTDAGTSGEGGAGTNEASGGGASGESGTGADGESDVGALPGRHDRAWWKEAVVYQIYPQSFNDSNGDGIGDLPGITEKLDYLDELGVDVVWLNPVYDSPQVDDGYDIADYRSIRDAYGTIEDWERLRDGLHERGIRLIMDLVVNHTSDAHEWFKASRRDPDGPYGDYYVWREGDPDEPPNNWESAFDGSAWSYDETREAWYLHLFHERQPDLNWWNPAVRDDVFEMMEWWFERDIDGFRMDVINLLSKPEGLPDGAPDAGWVGLDQFGDGPRIMEYLREMDERVLSRYDAMTVGETVGVDVETAREYTGPGGPLDMVFNFEHMWLDYHDEEGWWQLREWPLAEFREVITRWQEGLAEEGWNSLYLSNHDWPRLVSRFGEEAYRYESATMLATFLMTLQGTPFVYQGDEIGMTNYPWDSLEEFEDPATLGRVREALRSGRFEAFEEVRDVVRARSRDNARTPMQWDDSANAGFTDGDPWLPVNPNHDRINVAAERAAERSVLSYYRRLVELRHERDVLVYGDYELLAPDHDQVYAYLRRLGREDGPEVRALVALEFSGEAATVDLPVDGERATQLIENYDREVDDPSSLRLKPYEARVYELE